MLEGTFGDRAQHLAEVIRRTFDDEADLVPLGIPELWLKPAYFSTTTDQWTFPESYVIDPDANRVTMQIDHFTDFALTGTEVVGQIYLPILAK